ncbi:MAG: hypothetical protein RMM53_03105 [Bacteroidia bacterium]|nr:hypothetical protein [Bacteroidia bacterium]MDW8333186.1 hypothetical protein [Bacteroidia bacterium]
MKITKTRFKRAISVLALIFPCAGYGQGGFGYFYIGTAAADLDKYESALRGSLGSDLEFHTPGVHFGGRGFGGWGERILLGGNGFGGIFATADNDNGTAEISAGMGFFNIGVAAVSKGRSFLLPFVGLGAGGTSVRIKNTNSQRPVFFDQNHPVEYDRYRGYTNGGFAAEVGLSASWYILDDRNDGIPGGLALGLEVGGLWRAAGRWRDSDDNRVRGPERMGFQCLYLRFTVGGGGYALRKNSSSGTSNRSLPLEPRP